MMETCSVSVIHVKINHGCGSEFATPCTHIIQQSALGSLTAAAAATAVSPLC